MASVYEMVTDKIIAELEKGFIPWQKPWAGINEGAFNRISKKPYSLLNQLLLSHTGEYATFKQWSSLGGKIRKGAKAEFVVFWKINVFTDKDEDGNEVKNTVPVLRYYNVFHISDVEGVEPLDKPNFENESVESADALISDYIEREGVHFTEKENDEAFYAASTDSVIVPTRKQFKDLNKYYSTVFHELIHSTGHKSRLARISSDHVAAFGSEDYSKEELVAEIGSAALMNELGMETEDTFKNSAAYIQSWISVLKHDTRFIVSAAGKAEKAVKFMKGER